MKKMYVAPELELIELAVEAGFAASNDYDGNAGDYEDGGTLDSE